MPGTVLIARPARIHTGALAQIALAVIPSAVLLGFGQLGRSAYWLFGSLLVLIAWHMLKRNYLTIVVLAIGSIPATMLLRGAFYYSSLIAVLALGPICLLLAAGQDAARFKGDKPLVIFFAAGVFYWWAGYMLSGDYAKTIRFLELGLSASSVCLLGIHRSWLATALSGLGISTAAVAAGLMPYGGARLGIAVVDKIYIGNPVTLGLSSAVVLLLSVADKGSWLMLDRHPVRRSLVILLAAISLLLSTSRGSWLVTAIGMSVILVFSRRDRLQLLVAIGTLSAAVALVLQTNRGAGVRSYFEKAVSDENSLAKRTTGRADQWQNFPRVFDASPLWGFGPGSGKEVSLRYTKEGKPWHSLYLLLGTETGLIGLTALGLLLAIVTLRSFTHWRRWGEIGPLVGICCFMWIGVSVSGIDAISGVFLGFGFLSGRNAQKLLAEILLNKGWASTASSTARGDLNSRSVQARDLPSERHGREKITMRNELTLPYLSVRKARSAWGNTPSGLGFYDVAAYLLLGQELEQKASARGRPGWILDLGTYFGHSAFALLQGATRSSPSPAMRVLSLDIFRQPDWIRETVAADFLTSWGPDEFSGVQAWVARLMAQNGLPADAIHLRKQDVLAVDPAWLERHSEPPFDGIAIDCGKTPELMNQIVRLVCDPRVTRPGTILVFQDLFDWHAPWNAHAFWMLLKSGNTAMRRLDRRMTPIVQVRAHNHIGTVCDRIVHSQVQEWCDRFTDLANERTALREMGQMFIAAGCWEFALKIECLEVGALLRAGQLQEAEALIEKLDCSWPPSISDAPLQNAWRRVMHVKTGLKNLSLRRQTETSRVRAGNPARMVRWLRSHADALTPLRIDERQILEKSPNRERGFQSQLGSGGNGWQRRTS